MFTEIGMFLFCMPVKFVLREGVDRFTILCDTVQAEPILEVPPQPGQRPSRSQRTHPTINIPNLDATALDRYQRLSR